MTTSRWLSVPLLLACAAIAADSQEAQRRPNPQAACDCIAPFQAKFVVDDNLKACRAVHGAKCLGFEVRIDAPWTWSESQQACIGSYSYWQGERGNDPVWQRVGRYQGMGVDLPTARKRCEAIGVTTDASPAAARSGALAIIENAVRDVGQRRRSFDALRGLLRAGDVMFVRDAKGVLVPAAGSQASVLPDFRARTLPILSTSVILDDALGQLLASSEIGTIRGTINGGGDFVMIGPRRPAHAVFGAPGAGVDDVVSVLLASSEHGTIRGSINGGGDFVFIFETTNRPSGGESVELPGALMARIGTTYALDVAANGVSAVAVLEGEVSLTDIATGKGRGVRAGETAVVVPGFGVSAPRATPSDLHQYLAGLRGRIQAPGARSVPEALARPAEPAPAKAEAGLTGDWSIQYFLWGGPNPRRLHLEQDGNRLTGTLTSGAGHAVRVAGTVEGERVVLRFYYDNPDIVGELRSEAALVQKLVALAPYSEAVLTRGSDGSYAGTLSPFALTTSATDVQDYAPGGSAKAKARVAPQATSMTRQR